MYLCLWTDWCRVSNLSPPLLSILLFVFYKRKTHTISGALDGDSNQYGICAQTAVHLFQKSKQTFDNISLRLSILEIYNETLVDLLVDLPSQNGIISSKNKLNIIETDQGVLVPGLHIMPIDNIDDCLTLLMEAQANRAVAEHQLNHASSRSHIIYTYYITRTSSSSSNATATASSASIRRSSKSTKDKDKDKDADGDSEIGSNNGVIEDPIVHQSKLHIVDLAGSERVNKTGSVGNVQKEANYINRSLSFLEQVVIALSQSNRDHIPYRQSKLTYLLKDSLGGNSNTYLIACIWPRKDHSWETLSTLRFAARMKSIETHPVRNRLVSKDPSAVTGQTKQLQQQVDLLKKELALRDFIHQYDQWLPELTKQQILLTYKQSNDFLLSPPSSTTTTTNTATATGNSATDTTAMNPSFISSIEPIEVHSLSQVHLISSFYKDIIHELADNDLIRIQQAIHTVITKRYMNASSIHYHDKYSKLGKKILQVLSGGDGSQMTMINDGMNSIRKPTEDPINKNSNGAFSPTKPPLVPTNLPTMTQSTITTNTETTTQVTADEGGVVGGGGGGGGGDFQQVNSEYFQDFTQKTIAGKDLYSAYEELKETLKENKKRQKQIITLLNDQKFIIDELTIEINQYLTILQDQEEEGENGDDEDQKKDEKGDDNGAKEELENMILEKKEKLDASKKQYRTVHQELLLCKDQIQETQSLKKRAMNALLVAFNDYMKQLPGSES